MQRSTCNIRDRDLTCLKYTFENHILIIWLQHTFTYRSSEYRTNNCVAYLRKCVFLCLFGRSIDRSSYYLVNRRTEANEWNDYCVSTKNILLILCALHFRFRSSCADREPVGRRAPVARAGHRTPEQRRSAVLSWAARRSWPGANSRVHRSGGVADNSQRSGHPSLRSTAWPQQQGAAADWRWIETGLHCQGSGGLCGPSRWKHHAPSGIFRHTTGQGQMVFGGEYSFFVCLSLPRYREVMAVWWWLIV